MLWLFAAIGGYGSTALSSIADKFLVSGRIEKPAAYVFLVTTFSLVAFVFAPFGLQLLPSGELAVFLASGVFFAWSLLFLFQSFRLGEVSKMVPIVGIVAATGALVPSFVRVFLSGEVPILGFLAFFLLVAGAWLISFADSGERIRSWRGIGLASLSGFFLAAFALLLKTGEGSGANFVSALVWSRCGVFVGGLSLGIFPAFRRDIADFLFRREQPPSGKERVVAIRKKTGNIPTWVVFLLGKTLGGVGAFLIVFATYRGSAALVQALVGVQFAVVFLVALALSKKFPSVFSERWSRADWIRKGTAFACISLGAWLSARSGNAIF